MVKQDDRRRLPAKHNKSSLLTPMFDNIRPGALANLIQTFYKVNNLKLSVIISHSLRKYSSLFYIEIINTATGLYSSLRQFSTITHSTLIMLSTRSTFLYIFLCCGQNLNYFHNSQVRFKVDIRRVGLPQPSSQDLSTTKCLIIY